MSGDEKTITLTESELKALMASTVLDTLTRIGIESSDPLEMQKDFIHLRDWRRSTEAVKKKGLLAAVGFIVVSVLGLILKAFIGDG